MLAPSPNRLVPATWKVYCALGDRPVYVHDVASIAVVARRVVGGAVPKSAHTLKPASSSELSVHVQVIASAPMAIAPGLEGAAGTAIT